MQWIRGAVNAVQERVPRRDVSTILTVAGRNVLQGKLLADGGFAYVYTGTDADTGEPLAVRKVLLQDKEALEKAQQEIELLNSLCDHPYVVRFLGAEIIRLGQGAASSQAVYLFELCTGGTLLTKLEGVCKAASQASSQAQMLYCCPCLEQNDVLDVLGGTAQALMYLSRLGMVHYDVKSENLLLGADGLWKLGDFGSASEKTFDLEGAPKKAVLDAQQFIDGRCTPIYRAPELADVYLRWKIGPKVDVFALGCILFATLTGQHPFPMDSACANISATYRVPPEAEKAYTPAILRWLRRLLAREPAARPTAVKLAAEIEAYRLMGEEPPDPGASEAAARHGSRLTAAKTAATAAAKAAPAPATLPSESAAWVADFSAFAPAGAPTGAPAASAAPVEHLEPAGLSDPTPPPAEEPSDPAETLAPESASASVAVPAAGQRGDAEAAQPTKTEADLGPDEATRAFLLAAPPSQGEAAGISECGRVLLEHGAALCASRGSVVNFGGGTDWPPGLMAAVNAANRRGLGGAGVDGAFCSMGGDLLDEHRRALPVLDGTNNERIRTGGAVATGPARYGSLHVGTVIHAVGPNYQELLEDGLPLERCDEVLASAYRASMGISQERGIQYVGFALLSAGIFRGPRLLSEVLQIAVDTVSKCAYAGLREVHLVAFKEEEVTTLLDCMQALQASVAEDTLVQPGEPAEPVEPASVEQEVATQ